MSFKCVVIAFAAFNIHLASTLLAKDKDKLLNWCLNATLHKESPGKEDSLHSQCSPWSEKACCTAETTKHIHERDMHNFNLNHCYEQKEKNLSSQCRKYFNQDNCFYECEPHIGFWVVQAKRRIATERFHQVPLCESECNMWFEACEQDFTCVFNWPRQFKFSKGVNSCPDNYKCETFKSIYGNATAFCENVWDGSWKVTPDTEPCMKTWFDDPLNNPNQKVAEYYIERHFYGAGATTKSSTILLVCAVIFFTINLLA